MQCYFINSLEEIDCDQLKSLIPHAYPFLQPEFLSALEKSKSVNADSGWRVCHLVMQQEQKLIAFMPLYIKQHSYGEYVFDWSWAEAYQRHGFLYYPKLVTAIPFTPASGPRFIHHQDYRFEELWPQALQQINAFSDKIKASGWHYLFPVQSLAKHHKNLADAHLPLVQRMGVQYHWFNNGFTCFDDFLASFSSRKRKNLRKERQRVQQQGLSLVRKQGNEITADDWQFFFYCYQSTYAKRSGHGGYLTQAFFEYLAEHFSQQALLVLAYNAEQQPVAAALNFFDEKTLYGRYWGCIHEYDFLHFEACYYQGIEFCIEQGLEHFDPGAQGEHKIQRGFKPIKTCSLHHLKHPDFFSAVRTFVEQEEQELVEYMHQAREQLPFKQSE